MISLVDTENTVLSPYAVKSKSSRGREHAEKEDSTRTPFQKDRDRIIHCRAFRRLKMKTQVFVAHYGDHYRTRLTHSLEVSQISRDVARSLGLNEDLAEAIALAHDLGHTPFGHAGEEALDEMLQPLGLHFEHNEQSRRIVEELEHVYPGFPGLNLTHEVRQGLMKHQTPWDQNDRKLEGASLEAQVVNLADEIAYLNHDVDDGLRSGLIDEKSLESLAAWQAAKEVTEEQYGTIQDQSIRWSRMVSKMIGLMIRDLTQATIETLKSQNIQTLDDVYASKIPLVHFSQEQAQANQELREFLLKNLYLHPQVLKLSERGQQIIRDLFNAYQKEGRDPIEIKDYIAGMTDEFAESVISSQLLR